MKIAMVGLGDIAQKAYLPILTQRDDIELVFCTRDQYVLKKLSQQHRISEYYQDYRDLKNAKLDAVMIHSATDSHIDIASYFLMLGIPTFVDKPLAASADDCDRLYQLSAKYNTPLYVGFNRRFIPLLQPTLKLDGLTSLHWEKNRFNQPGDLREFVFDDFIHPLDSINLFAKNTLDEVQIITQFKGKKLALLDIRCQQNNTLLSASMNRLYGMTNEVINASFENKSFTFDSLHSGICIEGNQKTILTNPDWMPMLASKGFHAMIDDWLSVIRVGKLEDAIISRNLASHQLADLLCKHIQSNI